MNTEWGKPQPSPRTATLDNIVTLDNIEAFEAWAAEGEGVLWGVDVETNGVSPFEPGFELRLMQVADDAQAFVFTAPHFDAVVEVLRHHGPLVSHSMAAEATFLAAGGYLDALDWPWLDSWVAELHHEPRCRAGGHLAWLHLSGGLKESCARELGDTTLLEAEADLHDRFLALSPTKAGRPRRAMSTSVMRDGWARIEPTDPVLVRYAGLDAIYCRRLYDAVAPVHDQRAHRFGEDLLLARQLVGLQWRGMRVDQAEVERHLAFTTEVAEGARARTGLDSPMGPKVAELLDAHGAEVVSYTETGRPCWDRDALAVLVAEGGDLGRLAEALVSWRRAVKYAATYLDPMVGVERIHPRFTFGNTITFRMTAAEPPVQQYPREPGSVRSCLVADEGHVLVDADFAQIEARVAAAITGDPELLRSIWEGVDVHGRLATEVFELEPDDPGFTLARQRSKSGFFAWLFGAQPPRLARTLGVDIGVAERLWRRYHETFVEVSTCMTELGRSTYVETRTGRHIPLYTKARLDAEGRVLFRLGTTHTALNYTVQSSARDILASVLRQLAAGPLAKQLWHVVHDSIVLHVPAADAETAAGTLLGIMHRALPVERGPHEGALVPVHAEVKVADRWGPRAEHLVLPAWLDDDEVDA